MLNSPRMHLKGELHCVRCAKRKLHAHCNKKPLTEAKSEPKILASKLLWHIWTVLHYRCEWRTVFSEFIEEFKRITVTFLMK